MTPEQKRVVQARYRERNRDKLRLAAVAYRKDNPEKTRAAVAACADKEKAALRNRKWRENNPQKANSCYAAWAKAHPEARRIYQQNRRARKRSAGGTLSSDIASKLYRLQRGICACGCGSRLENDYHLDHIIPLALGGSNEDWNIQLLKPVCNSRKQAKHPVEFMQSKGFLL